MGSVGRQRFDCVPACENSGVVPNVDQGEIQIHGQLTHGAGSLTSMQGSQYATTHEVIERDVQLPSHG